MLYQLQAPLIRQSGCAWACRRLGRRVAGLEPHRGQALLPVQQGPCSRRGAPPQAAETTESLTSMDITGLEPPCDDFVCNSSPAVEATIRSFARDITRNNGVWTRSLLSRNVEYKDPLRSFSGTDGYLRLDFAKTQLQGSKAQVTKMLMLDNGTAVVSWRLSGRIGPVPVEVDVDSTLSLNLLTGQIEKHSEVWDLSKCSPPAALAWTLTRMLWSAQQASLDAKGGAQRVLDSLTSMDEDDPSKYVTPNPNDPTRFFQQKDNTMQDALLFAAFVAMLWFMSKAWGSIFTL